MHNSVFKKFIIFLETTWWVFLPTLYTIYARITGRRPKVTKCLVGKTALVTGGNEGIGYDICLQLASRGCTVIIADRSDSEKSRQEIISETGNPNVISKTFDLASFKSIRELAADLNKSLAQLDILVNNAAIAFCKPGQVTEDGCNSVIQINYLGHFLMTHLLLDLLTKSDSGRILFTTSCMSYYADIRLDDLSFESGKGLQTYNNSKWGMLVASNYFNEKLKRSRIISTAYHPGVHFSSMYKIALDGGNFGVYNIIAYYGACMYTWIFRKKTWDIGEFAVYLVTCKENVGGKAFFENQETSILPSRANDVQFCRRFIEMCEEAVKLSESEKLQ